MKHLILILLFIIFITSCQNDSNSRITSLELEIEELKDSIKELELQKVLSFKINAIPESNNFKVNESGKINFNFQYLNNIQNYNFYKINKHNDTRELIIENLDMTFFSYDYIPKSEKDSLLDFEAVFKINDQEISIPVNLKIDIKK